MPRYIIRCRWRGRSSYRHFANTRPEAGPVIRCPECSAEIDVDEDEVEEGEILSCPECESELEVSQTHPVHLNVISDDLEEEDDDEEKEEGKTGEDGDYLDEEEEEVDKEDEE